MKLSELIEAISAPAGRKAEDPAWPGLLRRPTGADMEREIGSIHYRAQDVRPGGLFVAIPGQRADGHDFIETARSRGASAVVVQKTVPHTENAIRVGNCRWAMGVLASRLYGNPAERLVLIGITGTNGKTTTAYLLESILASAGHKVGVIGTINSRFPGKRYESRVTTPESADLQGMLAEMENSGVTHVVMEVSSHGLHQERIRGCRYDVAIFTNLTQDHLDFHETMAAYWACKQRLFTEFLKPHRGTALVNCDDARGAALAKRLGKTAVTAGRSADCRIRPMGDRYDLSGIAAEIATPAGTVAVRSPLVGRHNMENIVCAAGAGIAVGLSPETVERGIAALSSVPGRLEPVPSDRQRFVFVDYAHTPDALENTLAALRSVTDGRIICVFGCGGDRDRGKRPIMGQIAGNRSDLAIVTSDNPRSEDPLSITDQVAAGTRRVAGRRYEPGELEKGWKEKGYTVEPDRHAAIHLAVAAAGPGDAILIAGKGHETYQILGDRTVDFDDREVAKAALGS